MLVVPPLLRSGGPLGRRGRTFPSSETTHSSVNPNNTSTSGISSCVNNNDGNIVVINNYNDSSETNNSGIVIVTTNMWLHVTPCYMV